MAQRKHLWDYVLSKIYGDFSMFQINNAIKLEKERLIEDVGNFRRIQIQVKERLLTFAPSRSHSVQSRRTIFFSKTVTLLVIAGS